MNSFFKVSLLAVFSVFVHPTFAQTAINPNWQTLLKDASKGVMIEIKFTQFRDSCGDGIAPNHRFAYRMKPTSAALPRFVTWKMDYVDCDGYSYTQQRSLELDNEFKTDGIDLESEQFTFIASGVNKWVYDVAFSNFSIERNTRTIKTISTPPNAIMGDDLVYFGKSTTLQISGGELATGASWVWYEGACGTVRVGTGDKLVVNPKQTQTYFVRAEGPNGNTPCVSKTVTVDDKSVAATGVEVGQPKLCRGSSTTLRINGGVLGKNAKWVWTKDGCDGTEIGYGATISVSPETNTVYFVKAVGSENTTSCVEAKIQIMSTMSDPGEIMTTAKEPVCEGSTVTLMLKNPPSVDSGVWKWHSGSCTGGDYLGSGESVTYTVLDSSPVFVYGENSCGQTNCTSYTLKTIKASKPPYAISGPSKALHREKIELSVAGGELGDKAQWQWYKGNLSGRPISNKPTIKVKAKEKTTYYVKAVGQCNETTAAYFVVDPVENRMWESFFTSDYKKSWSIGVAIGYDAKASTISVIDEEKSLPWTGMDGKDSLNTSSVGFSIQIPVYPIHKKNISFGIIPEFSFGQYSAFESSEEDVLTPSLENFDQVFTEQRVKVKAELAFGDNGIKILSGYSVTLSKLSSSAIDNGDPIRAQSIRDYLQYSKTLRGDEFILGLRLGRSHRKNMYKANGNRTATVFLDLYGVMKAASPFEGELLNQRGLSFSTDNPGFGISVWKQSRYKFVMESYLIDDTIDGKIRHADGLGVEFSFAFCINRFR